MMVGSVYKWFIMIDMEARDGYLSFRRVVVIEVLSFKKKLNMLEIYFFIY